MSHDEGVREAVTHLLVQGRWPDRIGHRHLHPGVRELRVPVCLEQLGEGVRQLRHGTRLGNLHDPNGVDATALELDDR